MAQIHCRDGLVAETPRSLKLQTRVQGLGYHTDRIHSVMPALVLVVASVRPALDPGAVQDSRVAG